MHGIPLHSTRQHTIQHDRQTDRVHIHRSDRAIIRRKQELSLKGKEDNRVAKDRTQRSFFGTSSSVVARRAHTDTRLCTSTSSPETHTHSQGEHSRRDRPTGNETIRDETRRDDATIKDCGEKAPSYPIPPSTSTSFSMAKPSTSDGINTKILRITISDKTVVWKCNSKELLFVVAFASQR